MSAAGDHIMGDAFSTTSAPELHVKLIGTAPFAKVQVIKDNKYVYSTSSRSTAEGGILPGRTIAATAGKTSYYYVRGEQADGDVVWVSPMWITYK